MHKRRAHNLGLFLSRAVSINSCPNCLSTFASRFSAINHLVRAYTIGHCPRNRSAHSHISHGGSTALQCRICHEWSTDIRQHQQHVRTHLPNPRPVIKTFRCRKHVVICASHADRQRCGIERGIWMAARHHHRRWRWVTSRTQQQEAAHRRSDEHGRSRTPKTCGKRQGREGEATPPGHGRSGPAIHRTTHVAGCSTAPNLGGVAAGHVSAANLISDRHIDEAGGTRVSPRGSERIGRPTGRAGPPHVHICRAMVASLVTQMQAMSPAPDPLIKLRNTPSDGSRGHNSASIQNQARGGYQTSIPSSGRSRSVGPQSWIMHYGSTTHGGHRTAEPSRPDPGTSSQRSSGHGNMNQLTRVPMSTTCALNTRPFSDTALLPSSDVANVEHSAPEQSAHSLVSSVGVYSVSDRGDYPECGYSAPRYLSLCWSTTCSQPSCLCHA